MGMGGLSEAMGKAARSFGAEIRTNAPVKEVIVTDGAAIRVQLADGEQIRASVVASNVGSKHTFSRLFRPRDVDEDTLK